jgi:hypothetical protein
VTCYTHPCKPYKVTCLLHYLPLGDESSPRGRWGICAPALPEVLTKEKRDGSIKGRSFADGRKQREGPTKSDATSPTVALESVLITATIDAHEGREVAIVDVPGAYLMADMDEEVSMCLIGRLAELMVKTAP